MTKEISYVFKDDNIRINIKNGGGCGNKFLVVILFVGHLRYDKFTQNCKSSNYANQILNTLSNNIEINYFPV